MPLPVPCWKRWNFSSNQKSSGLPTTLSLWTGAPGSPQRTWAENVFFRMLLPDRLSDLKEKTVEGFAHLFRPRYASANLGHPSRGMGLLVNLRFCG
jgi:hypothetical protein